MRCTERPACATRRGLLSLSTVLALAACGSRTLPPMENAPVSNASARSAPHVSLPAPSAARNWDEFKRQAAQRMVAANPSVTYMGAVPEPLLAIPVLEIELDADGSVRSITVLRHPRQAQDTEQIAMDAIRRGAPYGDMRHLKKPWKFAEVFLFDENRHFKPRTLDE